MLAKKSFQKKNHKYASENNICKMVAILSRGRWFNAEVTRMRFSPHEFLYDTWEALSHMEGSPWYMDSTAQDHMAISRLCADEVPIKLV